MPINELIKNYKNNLEAFENISRSKSDSNKPCVKSKKLAINADKFKSKCCEKPNSELPKSADAISYNTGWKNFNQKNLMFIEFKIRNEKNLNEDLIEELECKFDSTRKCFQHQIDKKCGYPINKIRKIFVCKMRKKNRESNKSFSTRQSRALFEFKKKLERSKKIAIKEIVVKSSDFFDECAQYYEFDIRNLKSGK